MNRTAARQLANLMMDHEDDVITRLDLYTSGPCVTIRSGETGRLKVLCWKEWNGGEGWYNPEDNE